MREKWRLSKTLQGRVYDRVTRERAPDEDPDHLRWIRGLPCALLALPIPGVTPCRFPVEAHHPTGAGEALKAPDRLAVPLCGRHHREELHLFAGTFVGWSKVRLHEWEEKHSDLYGYLGALRRALMK